MKWLWGCFLFLTIHVGAEEITNAAGALQRALNDEPTLDQLHDLDQFQTRTRFLDQWNVWMVEYFVEDERVAMLTINREGEVLERESHSPNESSSSDRIAALRQELVHARQTGNNAEVREIQELLEQLERAHPSDRGEVDLEQILSSVQGLGSFDMSVFRWPPLEGIAGISLMIEREEDGRWIRKEKVSLGQGRWMDDDVHHGEEYHYRFGVVKSNNQFSSTREFHITPISIENSELPVYRMEIPEEGLERMLADVIEDIEIDGVFKLDEKQWPMEVRLRGASTRHAAKKSYRIQFKKASPFAMDVIYLKAEPMDHTLQQEKLSCDLFLKNDVHCSEAQYVNLLINDRFQGVYLDIEPIRTPFKHHQGLDPEGVLIRASTFGSTDRKPLGDLRGKGDGLRRLETFLEEAQTVSNAAFSTWVKENMDWPRVRDYLALQVLCHRTEIEADDYFFYQDPDTLKWSFIPWDHNNGNFAVAPFGNRIFEPHISVFPQTIQDIGWRPNHTYLLHSRIFNQPDLRRDYLIRLREWTQTWLVDGKINGLIDANHRQVLKAYLMDPFRTPYIGTDPLLNAAEDLKSFSIRHGLLLIPKIKQYLDEQKRIEIDFREWNEEGCRVSLTLRQSASVALEDLRFVYKQGEEASFPKLNQPGSLKQDQTLEVVFEGSFERGGLLCLLPHDSPFERERGIPIDFCFIPSKE